jgi:uncharacterized protein YaaR (DUF327 family)
MEKIESTGSNRFRRFRKRRTGDSADEISPTGAFSRVLNEHTISAGENIGGRFPHDIDAPLEELIDAVHERGDRLKEHPGPSSITEYREAVSKFLQFIVKHAFEAEKIEGSRFHPLKKQYAYTVIRVINEKLDTLAAGILQSQYSQLDILRKFDEINGMIVDLLY